MKSMNDAHAEQARTHLAQQFDHWRHHRTRRAERIPPALWEQAVALTTMVPMSRVAKCLRVSWRDLHTHCAGQHVRAAEAPLPTPDFVEVTAPASWLFPTPAAEIELQRADGARLRMQYPALQLPMVALVRTFLETL